MTRDQAYLPFEPVVIPPRRRFPQNTCDCHFHVFEDTGVYPLNGLRSYTPTLATLSDYRSMAATLGIQRAVLVQPSVYGSDHSLYESILNSSASWIKGVAVVTDATPIEKIERWDALGTRGTRVNALFAGGAAIEKLSTIIDKVRGFGWHLQLLIDITEQPTLIAKVAQDIPVVVDHMGHFRGGDIQTPGFKNLLSLLKEGRTWVKLSAPYRLTDERAGFKSLRGMIDALVEANADQLVWGSDWPHPAINAPMVDDGNLANALFDWLDAQTLSKVLVENPSRLYWC